MLSSKNVFYILRTNNEIILFYVAYRHNKYVEDSDGHTADSQLTSVALTFKKK